MDFSESTFIFPPERRHGDVRMRIFTPGEELPMAGHPTIGSTFALALEGTIHARTRTVRLRARGRPDAGVARMERAADCAFAWMTQPLPTFGARHPRPRRVRRGGRALGRDLLPGPAGAERFVRRAVPVRAARDAGGGRRRRDRPRRRSRRCCGRRRAADLPVFFFTPERAGTGNETVYSRMLAPGFGIAEDPATGARADRSAAYLLHHRLVDAATPRAAC